MFFQLVSKSLGDNYLHLYAESEMLYSNITLTRTPSDSYLAILYHGVYALQLLHTAS